MFISKKRFRNIIKGLTDEIGGITRSLEPKEHPNFDDDTQLFYAMLEAVKRTFNLRERARREILELSQCVAMNPEFDKLLKELMPKIVTMTKSNCGAFYTVNVNSGKMMLKHSIGFGKNIYAEFDLSLGEGFMGNVRLNDTAVVVTDIADDTIYMVRTFLGKIKPRSIMVIPVHHEGQLTGVLVCASVSAYTEDDRVVADLIKFHMGVAVGNGIHFDRTKRLTNELSFQNNLIQDQYDGFGGLLRRQSAVYVGQQAPHLMLEQGLRTSDRRIGKERGG
jgi:transcriptional regulator with GAF, ATPase, and Fis domain